jgi:hypothetical protein
MPLLKTTHCGPHFNRGTDRPWDLPRLHYWPGQSWNFYQCSQTLLTTLLLQDSTTLNRLSPGSMPVSPEKAGSEVLERSLSPRNSIPSTYKCEN